MNRFQDHFHHPRHRGALAGQPGDDARDVRVELDNPVCGDELRLDLRVAAGAVREVAWEVRGCAGAVAGASALSELVRGRPLSELPAVDREAIDEALGGLPVMKRHGADLAAKGLRLALERLRGETA